MKLRWQWSMAAAVAMALGVVIASEAVSRYWLAAQPPTTMRSFVHLVQSYEHKAETTDATVWMIGNSTLSAGVDEHALADRLNTPVLKLPHGTATLRAYNAMLPEYVSASDRVPDLLVVTLSKDDLNLNGSRQTGAQRYVDYAAQLAIEPERHLTLRSERSLLSRSAVGALDAAYSKARGQEPMRLPQREDRSQLSYTDGPLDDSIPDHRLRIADWRFDDASFAELAELQAEQGIQRVAIVLLPITDVLAEYHDQRLPDAPYAMVRDQVAQAAAKHGFDYLDMGVATARHDLFFDPYHPNARGKAVVTDLLADWLTDGLPARSPVTALEFHSAASVVSH